jgi:hypothetical protein
MDYSTPPICHAGFIMKLMKMHDYCSGESRQLLEYVVPHHLTGQIEPTVTSIPWARVDQHTQPVHHARRSRKTCASCKFLVVFQCPVANNNVLAMYQASTCISINVVQFLISKDF